MMIDSKSDASSAGSFRSASVQVLTPTERQLIIDALKISKINAVQRKTAEYNALTYEIQQLINRVERANQVWLTTTSESSSK